MFAAAVLLAGCAVSDEKLGSLVADSAQYEVYTCPQLAGQETALKTRLAELDTLMAKAAADTGGAVVNAVAYRPEHITVRGSLDVVRRVRAEKNCPPPELPPAAKPETKPAKGKR